VVHIQRNREVGIEYTGLCRFSQNDGFDSRPSGDDLIELFTDAPNFPVHVAIIA